MASTVYMFNKYLLMESMNEGITGISFIHSLLSLGFCFYISEMDITVWSFYKDSNFELKHMKELCNKIIMIVNIYQKPTMCWELSIPYHLTSRP